MKPKLIIATNPEIAKKVKERYPRNKAERSGCESEIQKREALRFEYAKRLFLETQTREKVEYKSK